MAELDDGYDSYYADRLWQRLPGVYRALDSDDPTVSGPLQELVARIGAQVAVVRRSIDRLWADQSIETCDDWVIPYIGDLLGANLVNDDPRGQRLEVAKTIHYRRRKGTVAVLEEIARDVTGWQAHVVEGFRRLSRTRHGLDPAVGPALMAARLPMACSGTDTVGGMAGAAELLQHEGLTGALTGTLAGGFADLRSAHGASLAGSAFDEYFHTADVRSGRGAIGLYAITKLLVFVWRLQSFAVVGGTPVPVSGSSTQYAFDPTGRTVPLFLPPLPPEPDDWVDTWTPAAEWQVPGPLSDSLQQAIADPGAEPPAHARYPDVSEIPTFYSAVNAASLEPVPIQASPQTGTFSIETNVSGSLNVSYQYGFPAAIGAGSYDRTQLGDPPTVVGTETVVAGGAGLQGALAHSGGSGTVTIADSLTYDAVSDVGSSASPIGSMLVRAGADVRPVVRLPSAEAGDAPTEWVFTGGGPNSELTIDGLLVSGGDLVLRGGFARVRFTACTTDPGTQTPAGDAFASSVDGRQLASVTIWIEADPNASAVAAGSIRSLSIDHCVLGPIRTRNGGAVENATISDSIVQDSAPVPPEQNSLTEIYDPAVLAKALASADPVAGVVNAALTSAGQIGTPTVASLNAIIPSATIYSASAFVGVPLPPEIVALLPPGAGVNLGALNRALLQAAFPVALSPAALAISTGTLALERVTVLGRTFAHRLQASDSLLTEFTAVDDRQHGCIRFSALSDGSALPSQYQSPALIAGAALFTSTSFGDPAYGQLLETVDSAIGAGTTSATGVPLTISTGAETGSEMGAFSSQLAPIKEQGLLAKYSEYMPLGLSAVVVHVT